jgi:hypothetical protein
MSTAREEPEARTRRERIDPRLVELNAAMAA